jgi:hypothetical protein
MAIKFFNINSGETQVAETEPHITAMWACSDRSPNITQGQDFGWRRMGKPLEDVTEPDVLSYISFRVSAENAPVATNEDYSDIYDNEIRRKLEEAEKEEAAAITPAPPAQESIEDLEKRVALEERLASARAVSAQPVPAQAGNKATTTKTTVVK